MAQAPFGQRRLCDTRRVPSFFPQQQQRQSAIETPAGADSVTATRRSPPKDRPIAVVYSFSAPRRPLSQSRRSMVTAITALFANSGRGNLMI